MKIAMYKGRPHGLVNTITHYLICLRSFSKYSHCELVFTEPNIEGYALCASSSFRDGGVRYKQIKLNSGHWDVFDITDYDKGYAKTWFDNHIGDKYDTLGLAFFLIPFRGIEEREKHFCSEACGYALKVNKPYRLTPAALFKKLV